MGKLVDIGVPKWYYIITESKKAQEKKEKEKMNKNLELTPLEIAILHDALLEMPILRDAQSKEELLMVWELLMKIEEMDID